MDLDIIFSIAVLIMSVVVHEVSHGAAANYLGDPTARLAGRLSLNPLRHLDFLGSFVVPLLLILSKAGLILGWAKPVLVNPYNLRGKWGEALVAGAGPASNVALALFFGLLIRLFGGTLPFSFLSLAATIVLINIVLALFNLVPIPPLDGSKILFSFLPPASPLAAFLERYALLALLFLILFLWNFLTPLVGFLFRLTTGIGA